MYITGSYSVHYQRKKVILNPAANLVIYNADLPEKIYLCYSVTNVVEVNNHLLIGFKAHSKRWNSSLLDITQVVKSLRVERPWGKRKIKYYCSSKGT